MDKFDTDMGLIGPSVRVGTPEWDLFVLLHSDGGLRTALAEKAAAGGPAGKLLWEVMPQDPWSKTASEELCTHQKGRAMPQTQVGERVRNRIARMSKLRLDFDVVSVVWGHLNTKGRGGIAVASKVKIMNSFTW
jgi:hypothetical protein